MGERDFWQNPERDAPHFYTNVSDAVIREYGECISACAVNMLTGMPCDAQTGETRVQKALDHLLNDFFFVGIQEEWNSSMSMFASLTGLRSSSSLLTSNSRPGLRGETRQRVERIFEEFVFADDHLYRAALWQFHRLLSDLPVEAG